MTAVTVSTLVAPALTLLSALDAAVHASQQAHEATRVLTDTVLACH